MTVLSRTLWLLVLIIACTLVYHPDPGRAQLPTPNPLVVPPPPPPPPAQLRPVVAPQGIPSLAPIPSPVAIATPSSAERTFNCSCFGSGSPTHWMGVVTAPSYFNAQQAAVSTCLAYNRTKEPQPPIVATGASAAAGGVAGIPGTANQPINTSGLVANQSAVASALSAGQQLPATVTVFAPQQLRACSRCGCN
jgi:hypothetical protein